MNRKQNITRKNNEKKIREAEEKNRWYEQKFQILRKMIVDIIDLPFVPNQQTEMNKTKELDKKVQEEKEIEKTPTTKNNEEKVVCCKCGIEYKTDYMKYYPEKLEYECGNCAS
jgi:hypothetical protein